MVLIIKLSAPSISSVSKLPFILSHNISINYVSEVQIDSETDTAGAVQISYVLSYVINLLTNSTEQGPSLWAVIVRAFKKCLTLNGTRMFISVFMRALYPMELANLALSVGNLIRYGELHYGGFH
jgi:hypothetical protein